ncbi:MAG: hypothetical protein ACKOHI_11635 [Phycisphaerales bacterium]
MTDLRRRPMARAAAVFAAAAMLAAHAARAQEMAVPAVDDSPSAQLLLEQAADQAKANPREAVRLLVEVLDGAHDRLVRTPDDPDLFVTVAARAHAMLASDAALRTAFRREVDAESRASGPSPASTRRCAPRKRGWPVATVRRRLRSSTGWRRTTCWPGGAPCTMRAWWLPRPVASVTPCG